MLLVLEVFATVIAVTFVHFLPQYKGSQQTTPAIQNHHSTTKLIAEQFYYTTENLLVTFNCLLMPHIRKCFPKS